MSDLTVQLCVYALSASISLSSLVGCLVFFLRKHQIAEAARGGEKAEIVTHIAYCKPVPTLQASPKEQFTKMDAHNQERDLKELLDFFGSAFTLEDIASAYCEAKYNVELAGEILCGSQKTAADISTSASDDQFNSASEPSNLSSVSSASASASKLLPDSANEPQKSLHGQRNSTAVKSKVPPASLGTISGIVGRDYIQPKTTTKRYTEGTKPVKIDAKELPESQIWAEEPPSSMTPVEGTIPIHDNVVDFLFKMLGDGFKLDKNMIREVLGLCGCDVRKTWERLLDMSASTLGEYDDVLGLSSKMLREQYPDVGSASSEESGIAICNSTDAPKDTDRLRLQKEVLEALFIAPERYEEEPKKIRPVRAKPYSKPVERPLEDSTTDQRTAVVIPEVKEDNDEDDEDENSFKNLRKAVKEYWTTMKEYYRAAVDAFAKGDYIRADNLLREGQFFDKKAREANERAAEKILQANKKGDEEENADMSLNLHPHEPKEALRLLRIHLTNLSGTRAIKYLRFIVGTDDEDPDKRARRKRLIIKQLEKDSITWTEEKNGLAIRVQTDIIDRKSLSFAKKN